LFSASIRPTSTYAALSPARRINIPPRLIDLLPQCSPLIRRQTIVATLLLTIFVAIVRATPVRIATIILSLLPAILASVPVGIVVTGLRKRRGASCETRNQQ
jgi:hypothetical protein